MGRFTLRLPESLHQELESRAKREGVSLNQYIVYALTQQVASTYTIQVMPEASIQEQKARYEMLLQRLGSASREEVEAFLAQREPADPEDALRDEIVQKLEEKLNQ